MIENEIDVNTRIVSKENVMPGPTETSVRTRRPGNPEIDVITVWVEIVARSSGAPETCHVVHVEPFGAIPVSVGLINEFLTRKRRPVHAEDAPVPRHPLHRQGVIMDRPNVGV